MIERQQNKSTVEGRRRKDLVEGISESTTIGKIGQRIMKRQIFAFVHLTTKVINKRGVGKPRTQAVGNRFGDGGGLRRKFRPDHRLRQREHTDSVVTDNKRRLAQKPATLICARRSGRRSRCVAFNRQRCEVTV